MFYGYYSQVSDPLDLATKAITGFFAAMLALSVLGIVATVLTALCKCYKFRYMIYAVCCILFWICGLCFLIAFFMSILVPGIYWSCDFLEYSISGADEFNSKFLLILRQLWGLH